MLLQVKYTRLYSVRLLYADKSSGRDCLARSCEYHFQHQSGTSHFLERSNTCCGLVANFETIKCRHVLRVQLEVKYVGERLDPILRLGGGNRNDPIKSAISSTR